MVKERRKSLAILVLVIFSSALMYAPSNFAMSMNPISQLFRTNSVDTYFEDFNDITYRDPSTTAHGWGSGAISSLRDLTWEQLDFYSTDNPVFGLDVQGKKAYIVCNNVMDPLNSIQIFDIKDPRNIRRIGYRNSVLDAYTVEVEGDVLYNGVAHENSGIITLYNVTDPFKFKDYWGIFHDYKNVNGKLTDIDPEGNLVYYTVYKSSTDRSFRILNAEDPDDIDEIETDWVSNKALGLEVEGHLAYITASDEGLYIFSMYDKHSPAQIAHLDTPGNATDIILDGNIAYLADGNSGIQVIDIEDSTNPIIIGNYDTPGNARRMILQENSLYVADESGGLQVLDVANPSQPVYFGSYLLSESVYDVDLFGGIIVVASSAGVHTFRISKGWGVTDISQTVYQPYNQYPVWDVRVQGDIAYIAGGSAGFYTLNISNKNNPILLDQVSYSSDITKIDLQGDYVYASFGTGVRIFDVSDPTDIAFADGLIGSYTDVNIQGEVLYIAKTDGFVIANVSDPYIITIINDFTTGSTNNSAIWVEGKQLYLVEGPGVSINNFRCYDVTDLSAPALLGQLNRGGSMYDVHTSGDNCFIAQGSWISAFNCSDPEAITPTDIVSAQSSGVWTFGPYVLSAELSEGVTLYNATGLLSLSTKSIYPDATAAIQIITQGDFTYIANKSSLVILRHYLNGASSFYDSNYIAESTEIDISNHGLISSATLQANDYIPSSTQLNYYLSVDGGNNWDPVTPGVEHIFSNPGIDLRWRAEIVGTTTQSAYLYDLTIDYTYNGIPTAPIIEDLGGSKFTGFFKIHWNESIDDGTIDHYELIIARVDRQVTEQTYREEIKYESTKTSNVFEETSRDVKNYKTTQTSMIIYGIGKGNYSIIVRAMDDMGAYSNYSPVMYIEIKMSTLAFGFVFGGGGLVVLLASILVPILLVRRKKKNNALEDK